MDQLQVSSKSVEKDCHFFRPVPKMGCLLFNLHLLAAKHSGLLCPTASALPWRVGCPKGAPSHAQGDLSFD